MKSFHAGIKLHLARPVSIIRGIILPAKHPYKSFGNQRISSSISCIALSGRLLSPNACEIRSLQPSLGITGLLRITAHNLNLVRRDIALVVKLEGDILDKKGPDIVAEAVRIQMTLQVIQSVQTNKPNKQTQRLP